MSDITDTDCDAEDLIARLCGGLAPANREAFRRAAEATLAASPQCSWGPGSIYRALVPLWRKFFHPPFDDRRTGWGRDRQRNTNNLIQHGDHRPSRSLRVVE